MITGGLEGGKATQEDAIDLHTLNIAVPRQRYKRSEVIIRSPIRTSEQVGSFNVW